MNNQKTVLEGNRIIADFMGIKIGVDLYSWRPGCQDPIQEHNLNFHASWGWMMDVVEKIADTPMEDFINEKTEDGGYAYPITFGRRTEIGEWMVKFRGHGVHTADTLLKAAWEAAVDFIEWYNQQKT